MNRPKLFYFVTEDWYFCSHRLSLAVAAREAGYDVSVITRVKDHEDQIREAGIRVIPFEISRKSMNPIKEVLTIIKLIAIYRNEKPDLVHHVAMKPVLYGNLAARFSGHICSIDALAGMGWMFTSKAFIANILKLPIKLFLKHLMKSSLIIVQNPDDAKFVNDIGLKNCHIIKGSGVDTEVFKVKPELNVDPLIVLPSRMLWDKGVREFVQAAKSLKEAGVKARFVLVGAPDVENPASISNKQLLEWEQEGMVEWWGQCDNMPDVYARSHIVCLPSYREGLPKSLIEAASSGRPIVTTDAPGCREIVSQGFNGLLVPVRDHKLLAESLLMLIDNPGLRKKMGDNGRLLVEQAFSQEKVIRETLDLYRRMNELI